MNKLVNCLKKKDNKALSVYLKIIDPEDFRNELDDSIEYLIKEDQKLEKELENNQNYE